MKDRLQCVAANGSEHLFGGLLNYCFDRPGRSGSTLSGRAHAIWCRTSVLCSIALVAYRRSAAEKFRTNIRPTWERQNMVNDNDRPRGNLQVPPGFEVPSLLNRSVNKVKEPSAYLPANP